MRKLIAIPLLLLVMHGQSQNYSKKIDSLNRDWYGRINRIIETTTEDTTLSLAYAELSNYYKLDKPDSALYFGYKGLSLALASGFPKGEAMSMLFIAVTEFGLGNFSKSVRLGTKAHQIALQNHLDSMQGLSCLVLGIGYSFSGDQENAKHFLRLSGQRFMEVNNQEGVIVANSKLAESMMREGMLDSSFLYARRGNALLDEDIFPWVVDENCYALAQIEEERRSYNDALQHYHIAMANAMSAFSLHRAAVRIAQLHLKTSQLDSCFYYAHNALELAKDSRSYPQIIACCTVLAEAYAQVDLKKAYEFSREAAAYKDTLFSLVNNNAFESYAEYDALEKAKAVEQAELEAKSRLRFNAIVGSAVTLLIVLLLVYRNNRVKQKAKEKIEMAYHQLKSTQAQLIQSEKMASLGELTAGIAHEIQNPLNFVNNFSEINDELISELVDELNSGNAEEAKAIAVDIKNNAQKINEHGKRAGSIVKGMLEHSRKSDGQKEPTDINQLADECLRLAYHGMRAKDKNFQAEYRTDFDRGLPLVPAVSQDITRVLLNLINNAFYAVHEKSLNAVDGYQPQVIVSTAIQNDKVMIAVQDNGKGIPDEIKDKIFQPFFTTKPTGSGTGLGLSLSYDIIKANGGELTVDSSFGDGANFEAILPMG